MVYGIGLGFRVHGSPLTNYLSRAAGCKAQFSQPVSVRLRVTYKSFFLPCTLNRIPICYLLDRKVKIFRFWILIGFVTIIYPSPVKADWINLTGAQSAPNITVEPVAGVWKITGLELLEEKRIDL